MGTCEVIGSEFYGTVTASGSMPEVLLVADMIALQLQMEQRLPLIIVCLRELSQVLIKLAEF